MNKKFVYKLTAVLIPILFITLALSLLTVFKKAYEKTETELLEKEAQLVSFELSENLKRKILSHVRGLEVIAEARPDIVPNNHEYFQKLFKIMLKNSSNYYTVNWVSPDGKIAWITPETPENLKAIGKNILQREEVAEYLIQARDTKSSVISHVIDLYQGPKGMILYVPIFDKGNKFKGWFNGVLKIKSTFDSFFHERKLSNLKVTVKLKDRPNYIYTYEDHNIVQGTKFETKILNQTLEVNIDQDRDSILAKRRKRLHQLFDILYGAMAIIAIFLIYIIRSQFIFMSLNKELTRDRTLINLLSHDMATPLTIISENIRRLKEKLSEIPTNFSEVDRIIRSSDRQKDLLTKVRSFHATNIGKMRIELLPVSTSEIITEAIGLYEEQFKAKNISYKIEEHDQPLYCLADRMTAIHNVLGNVISNAIKFSNNATTVVIKSYSDKKWVVIEVQNDGPEISKSTLSRIFEQDKMTSTRGTQGESGTGLGMLQVKAFMDYYKGQVKIRSSKGHTVIQLYFRGSDIKI